MEGRGEAPFSLFDIDYAGGAMMHDSHPAHAPDSELERYLDEARALFDSIDPTTGPAQPPLEATASFEDLRWFLLPEDVRARE